MKNDKSREILEHLCKDIASRLLPEEQTVKAYFDRHPTGGGALLWNLSHGGEYKYSADDFDGVIELIIEERLKRKP